MTVIDLVGYAAAFCTTAAFVPQAVKALRYGDTKSLSLWMYILFVVGVSLWLGYGMLKKDGAVIAANGVTLMLALGILAAKIRNDVLPGKGR